MSMTDPIADMLTRMRNANQALHEEVDIPLSTLKVEIAKILKQEGFIKGYKVIEGKPQGTLRVFLKYGPGNERVINELSRASKPGRRVYAGARKIPKVKAGLGVAILSTSKGVMTAEEAKAAGVGGEVLCYVW
ncbi:MAG: 30S ribosomal protein S8 [candidate division NC10 bacterium]|nr:30S ribosomal protein S8 [candidate division NC10 bacterium]